MYSSCRIRCWELVIKTVGEWTKVYFSYVRKLLFYVEKEISTFIVFHSSHVINREEHRVFHLELFVKRSFFDFLPTFPINYC